MVVRPEAAQRQLQAEEKTPISVGKAGGTPPEPDGGGGPGEGGGEGPVPPGKKVYRRFFGSVELDPLKAPLQVKNISDEIIQHLQALVGSRVTVTLEIEADIPDGAPEQVMRTVTENAHTLKFTTFDFEE
ncbi:MAG TPA: hypothetical protein ENJ31_07150 [Anaerolineae bacterium]|nr:hypothetical protein [Anaerolineae bacterium]